MSAENDAAAGKGAVVVGVDGSEGGCVALDRALREGAHLGVPVTAVMAYDAPDLWAVELGALPLDVAEIGREVRRAAQDTVDAAVATARDEGVAVGEVRTVVGAGSAAELLCRVSRDAELLVVGHRGRGALATRLIGSVGLGVVLHATCPVLVVRPSEPAATG